jgi:hypothetical protein
MGCVQLDSKSFQVVNTWAPLAVCLPSALVTFHWLAATTQCPAVSTALELMRMPLHEPMLCPESLRRSMATLAGLLDEDTSSDRALDPLPQAMMGMQASAVTDAPTPTRNTRLDM